MLPTTVSESGDLDLPSQKRCIDCMIDAGSQGLCILANFSEQFVLSDQDREVLTRAPLEHVAGRVPVIVPSTHFGTRVCAERSRVAMDMGAAMVMGMPPRHGTTIRVSETLIDEFYARLSDALRIPIMVQHAPVAGTPTSAAFLARLASETGHVRYFKVEAAGAASKRRELCKAAGLRRIGYIALQPASSGRADHTGSSE